MSIRDDAIQAAYRQRQELEAADKRRDEAELAGFREAARATFYERLELTPGIIGVAALREKYTVKHRHWAWKDETEHTRLAAYITYDDMRFRITREPRYYGTYWNDLHKPSGEWRYLTQVEVDGKWRGFYNLASLGEVLAS
jgi:hypothetical protein